MKHSVEQLNLLLLYISNLILLISLPSISLWIKNDWRFIIGVILFITCLAFIVTQYVVGNKVFFPDVTITDVKHL